ncbi:hypothetical protein ElyMa_001549400 [Elysia marginata]|uniref:Uncharacterized protein n=1 Tax=Elysia marginata TaxID=1093978 RepID=A0AAV4JG79_9GAST|nr:hypothetical protein ElyMa_001549400 [Elysia marginata]
MSADMASQRSRSGLMVIPDLSWSPGGVQFMVSPETNLGRGHNGLEKLMLHGKVEGRRASGRQRQTFMDSLSRFINTSNKSLSKMDIFRQTVNREAWKSLIVNVCARPDT